MKLLFPDLRLRRLSFEYPGSAGAGPRQVAPETGTFEGKLPKAIRAISPIAPRSRNNWVTNPLVPPRSSLGDQPYCSSLGTVWAISLLFLPRNNLGHQPYCSSSVRDG